MHDHDVQWNILFTVEKFSSATNRKEQCGKTADYRIEEGSSLQKQEKWIRGDVLRVDTIADLGS